MPKQKPVLDPEEALRRVAQFIADLEARGNALGWHDDNILMSARAGKVLTFSNEDRNRFYRCFTALGQAAYYRPVSDESLRGVFEDAIFSALDGPREEFASRSDAAIAVLRKTLLAPAATWRIAFRIQWIEPAELPFTYRDIQFVKPDAAALKEATGFPADNTKFDEHIEEFLRELREGVGVAAVEVEAWEEASARRAALDKAYAAVDELTGFSAVVHPQSIPVLADVYTMQPVSLATVAVNLNAKTANVQFPIPLPFDIVRPKNLFAILGKHVPAERIASILGTGPNSEITDRIRACARYIGRAQQCSFQHRSDDAFLYLVVAIEALFGRKDYHDSLGYQLRMRVAHLIGQDLDERTEIEREIIRLYDTRSKLVHQGIRQVRPFDLAQARTYAVRCLSAMLLREPVKHFSKFAELEDWYRVKLLA